MNGSTRRTNHAGGLGSRSNGATDQAEGQAIFIDRDFHTDLSTVRWWLEIRALSELYRCPEPHRALALINEGIGFLNPAHAEAAKRVRDGWARFHLANPNSSDSETLQAALVDMQDDDAWWFRVQLPADCPGTSQQEDAARHAINNLLLSGHA